MNRLWLVLAALTLARMTMGFQFQGVAALGPVLTGEAIVTHSELGLLIGIYLLPGALFALPGGWFGKRFGDKRVVLVGLAMMALGGVLLAWSDVYEVMFTGRLISGLGAVLLNVLVTKMVTDWFSDHRIATAMGILISSWPLGISIALITMSPLQSLLGLKAAFFIPVLLCAAAWLLIAIIYTSPAESAETAKPIHQTPQANLTSFEIRGVVLAGCVWCLYNVAFILPLSFGAEYLVTRGETLTTAGTMVSLTSWLFIPALPLGALIAERIGRPVATMLIAFSAIAILTWLIPFTSSYILIFVMLGIVYAPAGGLIMALPSQVLSKQNRALGMGIFFTIYYVGMGVFPAIAGYVRELTGNPAAPLFMSGAAILIAAVLLTALSQMQIRQANLAGNA